MIRSITLFFIAFLCEKEGPFEPSLDAASQAVLGNLSRTPLVKRGKNTRQRDNGLQRIVQTENDVRTRTIRLKEEIATIDIGFDIDKSHIGYLLAKIAHHKLIPATNIDTS